ncbi:hypothetical protein NIES2100_69780 [Calothrix sp. NIES-2100]|nr:hypothetical protein NIES2100_69780 [Calothrix sp. NIES-2100]
MVFIYMSALHKLEQSVNFRQINDQISLINVTIINNEIIQKMFHSRPFI